VTIQKGDRALGSAETGAVRRNLTTNERLTLLVGVGSILVGVGSLVVSFLTYRNAADTSDLKNAIGNLSELATQTKRQADATHDQLGAVRDQVSALRDQAEEAKHQTAAISKQTDAIKASSDAEISAAKAQQTMAEATVQAQKPDVSLTDLTVNGLNDEPDKDGIVHATLFWAFRDTGGSSITVKGVIFGTLVSDALPPEMPQGSATDGAGFVVTNNAVSVFALKAPFPLPLSKVIRDALMHGDAKLFFFAKFEYWDNLKVEHSRCFGREFRLKEGASPIASGGDAYQCAT
jgi:hypothetical protein